MMSRPENSSCVSGSRWKGKSMLVNERLQEVPALLSLPSVDASPVGESWDVWWQAFLRGAQLPSASHAPPLKIVDLFCGAGGLGLGASLAARSLGFRPHFERIVDADADALTVYKSNLSVGRAFSEPVSSLIDYQFRNRRGRHEFSYPPEVVVPEFKLQTPPDLVLAGPPCQGHSNLNNHTRRDDPRNDLLYCTVAIGAALGARAMIIENVAAIENAKGDPLQVATELLSSEGYQVFGRVIRADALGWPQTRKRYFLTAIRVSDDLVHFSDAEPIRPKDVMWAIGDLAELKHREEIFDHAPRQNEENLARINWLFDNREYELANSERPDCHKNGTTYGAVYGRMYPDKPAPTITTGIGTPGQGRFIHPNERRLITPHEAARIQGFPDSYRFFKPGEIPKRKNLAKWIGDAVPSILGFHVCREVLNSVKAGS